MKKLFTQKSVFICLLMLVMVFAVSTGALAAANANYPWEGPLEKLVTALSGNTAKLIATIMVIITGLGMAFGEGNKKKLFMGAFGVSIALAASTFMSSIFGGAAGLIF